LLAGEVAYLFLTVCVNDFVTLWTVSFFDVWLLLQPFSALPAYCIIVRSERGKWRPSVAYNL